MAVQNQAEFPLVLKGGLVYDGTGAPGFQASIGIYGSLIAAVDRAGRIAGETELDCSGLAISPGFIDCHSHSDLFALSDPGLPMKVRQGVTLDIMGQDGLSVAPNREQDVPDLKQQLAALLGSPRASWRWRSVADYLAALDEAHPSIDCAYLVPHGSLRRMTVGMEDRPATSSELEKMAVLLDKGLMEGALGLSTGLVYPPCCYGTTEELIALGRVLARHGSPLVVHMRSESDRIEDALSEMLRVGTESRCPIHISHFKIAGSTNWHKVDQMLGQVDEARAAGVTVTADQYPYIASSTMLGAILPPWAHAGGSAETLKRLNDPGARARMRAEMMSKEEGVWDNFWKWGGPAGIRVSDIPSGRNPQLLGQNLEAAAGAARKDPVEFALDLLRDEELGVAMLSFSQSEAVIEKIMKQPYVAVGTDGLLGGKPHPRAFGTFPRLLGHYVRERKVIPLETAIHKATYLAAKTFRLAGCGWIKKGQRANLVVFDPAKVIDTATFENPKQFPVGIRDVIVEGVPVVAEGTSTEQRPGRSVLARGPGEPW